MWKRRSRRSSPTCTRRTNGCWPPIRTSPPRSTFTSPTEVRLVRTPDQDIATFNVFLEDPLALRAYVRHLLVACGHLPVIITELGLAGDVHGEEAQRDSLKAQLRMVDECGCAGATLFSWTDEWAVGGTQVEGWGFGVTDVDRRPKPALDSVADWARSRLADMRLSWPRVSVVVCAYNGDQLIEKCLRSLQACDYPELEVLICDDGSTDRTLEIARSFPYRILELPRVGLGGARNAGLAAATGEIVAFMDADAFCHPEWLYHLVLSFEEEIAGTGGSNLPVPESGFTERAVARSPGAPVEVLVTDDRAEHVAGCNMAFRADVLRELGGFDPIYTAAGDDVDVCWRLLDRGLRIGFTPAAQVRHHRRDSVSRYLRQQFGYGRAERLLESRHPHRFNRAGQARWSGSIYGGLGLLSRIARPVIYHGDLGMAPYQMIVRWRSELLLQMGSAVLPAVIAVLVLGLLGAWLSAWGLFVTICAAALLLLYGSAVAAAVRPGHDEGSPVRLRALVAFLHLAQPLARAVGRMFGTTPVAASKAQGSWSGMREAWLLELERDLQARGCTVRHRGPHSPQDLEVFLGPFASARVTGALLWQSVPVHRVDLRPRPLTVAAVGIGTVPLLLGSPSIGAAVGAIAVAGFTIDALSVSRFIRSSVRTTARGAGVWRRE